MCYLLLILRHIFCSEEEYHDACDDETSYAVPLLESRSHFYDKSITSRFVHNHTQSTHSTIFHQSDSITGRSRINPSDSSVTNRILIGSGGTGFSAPKPPIPFSKQSPTLPKPSSFSSSLKPSSSSSFKLALHSASSSNDKGKKNYVPVQTDSILPIYMIPKDIEDFIKNDKLPGVLCKPLSPSTYKDYFAALLYAEKWSEFQLLNITLELHEAAIYKKLGNKTYFNEKDDKIFATFKLDSSNPEERPFLLSRDFVFAKPSGCKVEPFQGIIYRVVKSTNALVEFEEGFYYQHHPSRKYDISFSFNRVCLKRAHQAISSASDTLFKNCLFPDCLFPKFTTASAAPVLSSNHKLDSCQDSAVRRILSFQGSPPFLVEGPLCVTSDRRRSGSHMKTGMVVQEAVLQIFRTSPKCRILICAPLNSTCDVLMRNLKNDIPEADMFRANAAFREADEVPIDILSSCLYKGECFSCPKLQELKEFRVILSTFVSSFRLHNEGVSAGHFSHIFLMDASSAIEPETMIPLSNLANENTTVIVTGAPNNQPGWVRSDIARKNGLKRSYFERLRESKTYKSYDPLFIMKLVENNQLCL